ncbi:hypothetical protein T05_11698, partial [Trichinella murrelli]
LSFYGVPFGLGNVISHVHIISFQILHDKHPCYLFLTFALDTVISHQTTLRQSSSAGARIDLSSVRFQCDMTKIIAADGTQIAFPTVLMFFLVTQVRNCEDESRILNDLHRIT